MARPQQISAETITQALAAHPEVTAAEFADALGIGQSTAAKRLAALEAAGSVRRAPGGCVAGTRVADRWSVVPSARDTVAVHGGSDRLARGGLGALVHDYLAERRGEAFGPVEPGKALGRSQGAVSNSLATMAARGEVELVGDKPRRYRIAG